MIPPTRFESRWNNATKESEAYVTVYIDQHMQPELPYKFFRDSVERQLLLDDAPPEQVEADLGGLEKRFEAWKNSQSDDFFIEGMPIRDWPAVNRHQVEALGQVQILSVQQLAETSDSVLERIGAGFKGLKLQAQTYLENLDRAEAAEKMIAMEQRLDDLAQTKDGEIEALKAQIAALTAAAPKVGDDAPQAAMVAPELSEPTQDSGGVKVVRQPVKRRGRPPKNRS